MVNRVICILVLLNVSVSKTYGYHESEREIELRELKEDAAKNSILLYDQDKVEDVTQLEYKVKALCKCEVDHLPAIESFILHYTNTTHLPANKFQSIKGIVLTDEDDIIMPPDDEIKEIEQEMQKPPDERQNVVPNDPLFKMQWSLTNADINWKGGAEKYLSDSQGGSKYGPEVIVAVIDTGVDYNHPDLKNEMWKNPGEIAGNGIDDDNNGIVDDVYGANFKRWFSIRKKGDPMDDNGHGTHCAGIIAASANNRKGIAGVAGISKGKVKIMALRALSFYGAGSLSEFLAALNYAIKHGAKISSNSYGGNANTAIGDRNNEAFEEILRKNRQHLFISAAGNSGGTSREKVGRDYFPGGNRAENHISVASSTSLGTKSSFSSFGTPFVHVFAPGSDILSTWKGGRYAIASGTSMACPYVSGLAALIMSMRGNLNGAQVKKLIEDNVQVKSQFKGLVTTGGLIDIDKTISAVISGDTSGPDPTPAPVCKDNDTVGDAWCRKYRAYCYRNGYEWFRNDYCQKTCCSCKKACENRYSDAYCCKYKRYCTTLLLGHWFRKGCKATCGNC